MKILQAELLDNIQNPIPIEEYDLIFLEIKCGEEIQDSTWIDGSLVIENYSCDLTSSETSLVKTPGAHHLQFELGGTMKRYQLSYRQIVMERIAVALSFLCMGICTGLLIATWLPARLATGGDQLGVREDPVGIERVERVRVGPERLSGRKN